MLCFLYSGRSIRKREKHKAPEALLPHAKERNRPIWDPASLCPVLSKGASAPDLVFLHLWKGQISPPISYGLLCICFNVQEPIMASCIHLITWPAWWYMLVYMVCEPPQLTFSCRFKPQKPLSFIRGWAALHFCRIIWWNGSYFVWEPCMHCFAQSKTGVTGAGDFGGAVRYGADAAGQPCRRIFWITYTPSWLSRWILFYKWAFALAVDNALLNSRILP